MKNTKTNKKQSKRAPKPEYVVDLRGVRSEYEAVRAIALTKFYNQIYNFNNSDIEVLKKVVASWCVDTVIDAIALNNTNLYMIGCGVLKSIYVPDNTSVTSVCMNVKMKPIKSTKKPNIFKRFWNWITRKK